MYEDRAQNYDPQIQEEYLIHDTKPNHPCHIIYSHAQTIDGNFIFYLKWHRGLQTSKLKLALDRKISIVNLMYNQILYVYVYVYVFWMIFQNCAHVLIHVANLNANEIFAETIKQYFNRKSKNRNTDTGSLIILNYRFSTSLWFRIC